MGAVLVAPASGRASELGDRIAERLCYPQSVRTLRLDAGDTVAYRASDRIAGDYRDIQGAEARAWFEKTPEGAVCRTPATSTLSLFFCAAVTDDDGTLRKGERRLCL